MMLFDLNKMVFKVILVTVVSIKITELCGISDALSAVFCGLLCITPNILGNFRNGVEQLLGSLLGIAIGYVAALFVGLNCWGTALGVATVFYLCYSRGWESMLTAASFTVLYVHLIVSQGLELSVLVRLQSVAVGIAVATAVNYGFSVLRHHQIYGIRFRQLIEQGIGILVPLLEAINKGDTQQTRYWLVALRKILLPINNLSRQLNTYSSLGQRVSRFFGVKEDKLLELRLFSSAWLMLNQNLLEIGELFDDELSSEVLSANSQKSFHKELETLLTDFSVDISRIMLQGTSLKMARFDFNQYQEQVYQSSDGDEMTQSLYLHLYFKCIGVRRNMDTIYRHRDILPKISI